MKRIIPFLPLLLSIGCVGNISPSPQPATGSTSNGASPDAPYCTKPSDFPESLCMIYDDDIDVWSGDPMRAVRKICIRGQETWVSYPDSQKRWHVLDGQVVCDVDVDGTVLK